MQKNDKRENNKNVLDNVTASSQVAEGRLAVFVEHSEPKYKLTKKSKPI